MVSVDETFPQGRVADELRVERKKKSGRRVGQRREKETWKRIKQSRERRVKRSGREKKEDQEASWSERKGKRRRWKRLRSATRRWHFAS